MVIVLGFLVLITVMAVAFFSSITTEAQSSHLYARNVQTQQLAQSAVSIAMSQIKDATTRGSDVTWISQPGMIRTFNSSGGAVNSHRLYSSSSMKLGGSIDPESDVGVVQRKEWPSRVHDHGGHPRCEMEQAVARYSATVSARRARYTCRACS